MKRPAPDDAQRAAAAARLAPTQRSQWDEGRVTVNHAPRIPLQAPNAVPAPVVARASSIVPTPTDEGTETNEGGCRQCAFRLVSSDNRTSKWEDTDAVNAQIVKDLNEMSLKERESLFDDIHGVLKPVEETTEFLDSMLESMDTALKWVKNRQAYERAKFLSPAFVEDRDLRLMMLRSHDYEPILAAKRMVKWFEFKLRLFGIDKLTKATIGQDDLSPDMLSCLKQGMYQLLPSKDRTGRTILFICIAYFPPGGWKSYFGMLWYVIMLAVRDVEVQKKGLVTIAHHIGTQPPMSLSQGLLGLGTDFVQAIPGKAVSYHFLYDDPVLRRGLAIFQHVLSRKVRLRVRGHFGSSMECIYKLMSYGLTADQLPFDFQGNLDTRKWIQLLERVRKEEQRDAETQPMIIVPKSVDVVIGRGTPFQTFVGNVYLADVVRRNKTKYLEAMRTTKPQIMLAIVEFVRRVRGGRFLKRASFPDGTWVEVDDEEARKKVGHTFRSSLILKGPSDTAESIVYTAESGETVLVPACSPTET